MWINPRSVALQTGAYTTGLHEETKPKQRGDPPPPPPINPSALATLVFGTTTLKLLSLHSACAHPPNETRHASCSSNKQRRRVSRTLHKYAQGSKYCRPDRFLPITITTVRENCLSVVSSDQSLFFCLYFNYVWISRLKVCSRFICTFSGLRVWQEFQLISIPAHELF